MAAAFSAVPPVIRPTRNVSGYRQPGLAHPQTQTVRRNPHRVRGNRLACAARPADPIAWVWRPRRLPAWRALVDIHFAFEPPVPPTEIPWVASPTRGSKTKVADCTPLRVSPWVRGCAHAAHNRPRSRRTVPRQRTHGQVKSSVSFDRHHAAATHRWRTCRRWWHRMFVCVGRSFPG